MTSEAVLKRAIDPVQIEAVLERHRKLISSKLLRELDVPDRYYALSLVVWGHEED
jgi:hypothetical protein